jgi:hypothetical protein
VLVVGKAHAQTATPAQSGTPAPSSAPKDSVMRLQIYGFGQGDLGFDFRRSDPNWYDVNRPSKLPATDTEFGANGHAFVSPRQSRFGVKGLLPTDHGDMFAQFEFDMFGVGVDAGQTTIRLRLAYGQWGQWGGGQLWSPFMDNDVFPNILDYWGPNGMIYFRNTQVFWEPIHKKSGTSLRFALERPGASADGGDATEIIDLSGVFPRFPYPDLSGGFRYEGKWGHVKLAAIVRDIRWNQVPADTIDLSGHTTGWGTSLGGNLKINKENVVRLQANYGAGIENYFNDAPFDVGAVRNPFNRRVPFTGRALPIFGAMAYLDHNWNEHYSTAIGWSMVNITNTDAQLETAYHNGQYATANLLWTPVKNVMMGGEFQYARRANFADHFEFDGYRLQFSVKYSFSQNIGGAP